MQKRCQDNTMSSHEHFTQLPLKLTLYISMKHLGQNEEINIDAILQTKLHILFGFYQFPSCILITVPRSNSGPKLQ